MKDNEMKILKITTLKDQSETLNIAHVEYWRLNILNTHTGAFT